MPVQELSPVTNSLTTLFQMNSANSAMRPNYSSLVCIESVMMVAITTNSFLLQFVYYRLRKKSVSINEDK